MPCSTISCPMPCSTNDKNLNSEIETINTCLCWRRQGLSTNDKNLNSEIETGIGSSTGSGCRLLPMIRISILRLKQTEQESNANLVLSTNDKNLNSEIETRTLEALYPPIQPLPMIRISILRLKLEEKTSLRGKPDTTNDKNLNSEIETLLGSSCPPALN